MKKYAELLVEAGYADRFYGGAPFPIMLVINEIGEPLEVFKNSDIGNKQAQAIEDYIYLNGGINE